MHIQSHQFHLKYQNLQEQLKKNKQFLYHMYRHNQTSSTFIWFPLSSRFSKAFYIKHLKISNKLQHHYYFIIVYLKNLRISSNQIIIVNGNNVSGEQKRCVDFFLLLLRWKEKKLNSFYSQNCCT